MIWRKFRNLVKVSRWPWFGVTLITLKDSKLDDNAKILTDSLRYNISFDENRNKRLKIQICSFYQKIDNYILKAYLNSRKLSYDFVSVRYNNAKDTKFNKYPTLPIAILEDLETHKRYVVPDTSQIISVVESIENDECTCDIEDILEMYPAVVSKKDKDLISDVEYINKYDIWQNSMPLGVGQEDIVREKTWREWIHTEFIKYLSLRLYYTRDDAEEHMKHIFEVDKEFKDWPWYFKALSLWVERNVLYRIMQRQMRKSGVGDVSEELIKLTELWLKELDDNNFEYNGGKRPNIADFTLFGCLSAVRSLGTFRELTEKTRIISWFSKMENHVNKETRVYSSNYNSSSSSKKSNKEQKEENKEQRIYENSSTDYSFSDD